MYLSLQSIHDVRASPLFDSLDRCCLESEGEDGHHSLVCATCMGRGCRSGSASILRDRYDHCDSAITSAEHPWLHSRMVSEGQRGPAEHARGPWPVSLVSLCVVCVALMLCVRVPSAPFARPIHARRSSDSDSHRPTAEGQSLSQCQCQGSRGAPEERPQPALRRGRDAMGCNACTHRGDGRAEDAHSEHTADGNSDAHRADTAEPQRPLSSTATHRGAHARAPGSNAVRINESRIGVAAPTVRAVGAANER